ncbi:MAG: MFS transporter [Rhizobiales bacterium]|nr:MFS transporter [Hyphomicrobiales bacterium]MBO6699369.1 MFS transporter [Hyphomicrobiales bacterium]MBO6736907.1 MFS transporter [Hyphomicrobiales bacterium]MBO6912019.1 MFS transporter [Hyphomicrobiales bacterium]
MHDIQRDIWLPGLATIVNVVPFAMLTPLVVVRLSESGAIATMVAAYGMAPFIAILAISPITPRLLSKFGLRGAHLLGLSFAGIGLLATAGLLAVGSEGLIVYLILAFLLGGASALTWTSTEALIASRTPDDRLGTVTALYQTGLGLAFAAGPFLPVVLSSDSEPVIVMTVALVAAALVIRLLAPNEEHRASASPDAVKFDLRAFGLYGAILAAAFVGGVFEVGLNSVFPYIAIQTGLPSAAAIALVGTVAIGALAAQLPLGWMADRGHFKSATILCLLSIILGVGALGAATYAPILMWSAAVLIGAGGGALYTLAMIQVAGSRERLPVATLTSIAVAAYTLGAALGPFAAGLIIDTAGTLALCAALIVLPVLVLTMSLLSTHQTEKDL